MKIKIGVLFAVLFLSTACFKQTVSMGSPMSGEPTMKMWRHGFIAGLIMIDNPVDGRKCGGGVAQVETIQNFWNLLVGSLTGGIYTPTTTKLWCNGGAAALDLPEGFDGDLRAVSTVTLGEQQAALLDDAADL